MTFKDKRVFVSGGNGVIGNELIRRLHRQGAVLLVGDLKKRPRDWPKDIIYRQGDLNFITAQELSDFQPEIFFHLAATFERSTETYGFWEENFQHNVNLSHHLMTLLKEGSTLRKVIFASSYLIYDKNLYNFDSPVAAPYSLKEADPINPRNLTGCAKLSHEVELNFLKEFKGKKLQVINARIYRSYGLNSRDIISRWVRMLLKDEVLTVFNKENIFDYVFAGDVAEGLIRLAKTDFNGVVNLGSGRSRKITEVLDVLRQHFPKLRCQDKGQEILYEASQADVSLLKRLTGWTPTHRLEEAIPKIIKFEKTAKATDQSSEFNILITSLSKKVGLIKAVRLAMAKIGNNGRLYGGDGNPDCLGRYFVDQFWEMPRTAEESLEKIKRYCLKEQIKLIIPSRDGELEFWASHQSEFNKLGIHIMVSGRRAIRLCLDKLAFYRQAHQFRLPAIKTVSKLTATRAKQLVVKERFGAGSQSLRLDINRTEAANHARSLQQAIFQPYLTGKEYSADLYVSKTGSIKGIVVRERNLVVSGESQVTTTVANKKIEAVCAKLAHQFKLYGHSIIQLLLDKRGRIYLIECNPRFGGASTASLEAGLDTFYWLMLETLGQRIDDYPFVRTKQEIRQVRYPADLIQAYVA